MRLTAKSPLLAAAACFLAFAAVLAGAYAIAPIGRLDAIALHGLMALDGPFSHRVDHVIVHSADPLPVTVVLAALFAWGWAAGRRQEALAAVALVAGANLTGLILKVALAHPRFHPILGGNQVGAEAYPSGHATTAMSIALAAVLVAPVQLRSNPHLRVAAAFGAAVYAIVVSTWLLVLGWHFPSDVLGGLLVSSGFFFLAVAAIRAGAAGRAGVAAKRVGLALSPGLGGAAVAGLAGVGVIALSRADELLAFARLHTVATVTALAVMAVSAGLVASATLISDP
jgi:membrane-associated phospholipid phosphatase